ncbi:MAG: hypothetical protein ACOYIH_10445 [Candidatus Fimadaptatus sp.]|jgi:hypothetical protein
MWWTVFPGVAVGVFQVYAMRVYMRGLGAGGRGKRKRVLTGLLNVVLVLGLLIGCACASPDALLWGAGGMCGAMIVLALFLFIRSIDD